MEQMERTYLPVLRQMPSTLTNSRDTDKLYHRVFRYPRRTTLYNIRGNTFKVVSKNDCIRKRKLIEMLNAMRPRRAMVHHRVVSRPRYKTSYSCGLLALACKYRGRWTEAEKTEMQVLETRRRVIGGEHPLVLTSMAGLATTYWNQGRPMEAEQMELKVLETRKRVLGEENPDTLTSMNNLAFTMKEQGRKEDAIKLMAECVQRSYRVLGTVQAVQKNST